MTLLPFFLSFAALCTVVSIGLGSRRLWMWYFGWILLYLYAGYVGAIFYGLLFLSESPRDFAFALLSLFGGLLFWLPIVLWWISLRRAFRRHHRLRKNRSSAPAPA